VCWMMTSLFFVFFSIQHRETGYFYIFFFKWCGYSKRNILEWKSSHGVTLNSVALEKSPFKIRYKLKMSPKGKVSRPFSKPNFRFLLARFQFKTSNFLFIKIFLIENAIYRNFTKANYL